MDFQLSDEQRAWQMKAREFAEKEVRPISLKRDAIADPFECFDWEIMKKGSELGFRTAAVSKEQGGHGIDFVTQALVMAELAKGDSAISKAFSQNWKWSHLIAAACNDDQRERFLKPFLADDMFVMGYGVTEATAGSDNRLPPKGHPKAGVRLRAERDGEDWILNGDKQFIANGSIAKLFFIVARTDPSASMSDGSSLFMVDTQNTPGFRVGKVFNKSGWRFYQNAELIFENARVPHANVVGEINGIFKKGEGEISGDLFGDLELAANALGVCDAACDAAVEVAKNVAQGGALLQEQQSVKLKLGRMHMLTEALRSYVLRTAWEHDQKFHSVNAGLVMNFATDVIEEVTELCMDVHDFAEGPMNRNVDKLVRDSFIWRHLAGDTVQRLRVAGRLLQ